MYGAFVALKQDDFKFVIGYSSVSHMGFVLLGLATLNEIGTTGAVLQMFSHGVIGALLFAKLLAQAVFARHASADGTCRGDDCFKLSHQVVAAVQVALLLAGWRLSIRVRGFYPAPPLRQRMQLA